MPDRECGSYSLLNPKTAIEGWEGARDTSGNFRFLPEIEKPHPTGSDASDSAGPSENALPVPDDGLTPRKRLALSLLLCGNTSSSVAATLGVSSRTVYTWRHEPLFAAQLNARCAEAIETNAMRARNLLLKSTSVLSDALNSRDRFNWALKMVNAHRLWLASQSLPAFSIEQVEAPPFEADTAAAVKTIDA